MENLELASTLTAGRSFKELVRVDSGVNVQDCYQCGKCSAGCPLSAAMDYTPHQVIRMLQLGLGEKALGAKSIWVCAHCATCYARCPKGIDIPKLMETLRMEAKRRGKVPVKTVDIFSDTFLSLVENFGRVQEALLIAFFNLKSGQLFKDVLLGPPLLLNGKVHPLPKRSGGQKAVKRIFERVRAAGGEKR